jgi:hypothetical protein
VEGKPFSEQDVLQRLFDRLYDSQPRLKLPAAHHELDLVPASPLQSALGQLFPKVFGAAAATSFDASLIEAKLAEASTVILLDELGLKQESLNHIARLLPASAILATSQQAPFDDVYESIEVEAGGSTQP